MNINLDLIDLPERDLRASVDEDALDELAASLRDNGQLQAIGVKAKDDGRFEVVFGARRTRAARLNKWQTIRAEILEDTRQTSTQAAKLIENVQRLDMTPIEEAYGLLDLIGDGAADVRELQRQTGKSRAWIQSRLALANLPDDLQGAVQAGVLGIQVAQIFGTIENTDVRDQYVRAAIENGCTVEIAKIWAGQAHAAESGIMAMDQLKSLTDDQIKHPQVVDQQYHCFLCAGLFSWRRVNTLVVCGSCQDIVAANRSTPDAPSTDTPLAQMDDSMQQSCRR